MRRDFPCNFRLMWQSSSTSFKWPIVHIQYDVQHGMSDFAVQIVIRMVAASSPEAAAALATQRVANERRLPAPIKFSANGPREYLYLWAIRQPDHPLSYDLTIIGDS